MSEHASSLVGKQDCYVGHVTGTPVLMSLGVGGNFTLNALGRNGVVDF